MLIKIAFFSQDATSHHRSKNPPIARKNILDGFLSKYRRVFKSFGLILLNLLVISYVIYAGVYWKRKRTYTWLCWFNLNQTISSAKERTSQSTIYIRKRITAIYFLASGKHCDLEWCDGYGMLLIIIGFVYIGLFYYLIVKRYFGKYIVRCCQPLTSSLERLQNTKWEINFTSSATATSNLNTFHADVTNKIYRYGRRFGTIIFYVIILVAVIIFLVLDTVNSRNRLISSLGVIVILGLGWIFSKYPGQVSRLHRKVEISLYILLRSSPSISESTVFFLSRSWGV